MAKKRRKLKKTFKRKAIIVTTVVSVVVACTLYVGVGIVWDLVTFSKERLVSDDASVQISTVTGEEYYSHNNNGTRKNVEYDDIPQVMIDAVVAAEDSRFYKHNGFDLPRILKALMGNIVSRGITSGGSTITQQVIKKVYYPDAQRTVKRKLGEIFLSIRADASVSKEEIMEIYLNKIYFGYGNKAIGIYAASKYYFGKEVSELTLPEAALLAGALNSPNQYDPFNNLTLAQQRRDIILKLMWQHGYITEEEYENTKAIPIENTLKYDPLISGGSYQAYADMVTREIYAKTGYDPNSTSMTIYTYMDPTIQEGLDDIASGKSYTFANSDLDCGAIVQDVNNGRIVGVLSGRNYTAMDTSNAYAKKGVKGTDEANYGTIHQPGSSLKPIIAYAAAFEYLDWSTAHLVQDIPIDIGGGKVPQNFNNTFHGDVTIKNALQNSWNGSAMATLQEVIAEVGVDEVQKYLEGFGFDMTNENLAVGYAMGSWTYGTTPQEEAGAYACIANGGTYYESHCVQKIIINSTGEEIDFDTDIQNNATRAISEESAFMIRSVMTDYVSDATGAYSYLGALKLDAGAKSGTSSYSSELSNKSIAGKSKDGWMSAYTADYAWSVWVGYPDGVYKQLVGTDARKVSAQIAKLIHPSGVQNSYPSQPSGVVQASCVSGIYPYISPFDGIPESRIATGYFKSTNKPSTSTTSVSASINALSEFSTSTDGSLIYCHFGTYDPEGATHGNGSYKTYTVAGKNYTLPYYGDLSSIYGAIAYRVQVLDSSGNTVYTYDSENPDFVCEFNPGPDTYTIIGSYAYKSNVAVSNTLNSSVTITTQAGYIPSNTPVTEDTTTTE